MTTCPTCQGTKKQTLRVTEIAARSLTKKEPVEINCVICRGTGEVTQETVQALEDAKEMWCECKGNQGAHYIPDGRSKQVRKHHWRCNKCGKVTQIG